MGTSDAVTRDAGRTRLARAFAAWARLIRRRVAWLTAAVVALTLVLAGGLPRLAFDSSQATMVPDTSQVYLDNLKYQQSFGGELMVVVLDGDVRHLFTPRNRAALAAIESEIAGTGRFSTIIGPDTAMEFAHRQVDIVCSFTRQCRARVRPCRAGVPRPPPRPRRGPRAPSSGSRAPRGGAHHLLAPTRPRGGRWPSS